MRACGYVSFELNMPIAAREHLFDEHNKKKNAVLPRHRWRRGKWHNGIVPYSLKGTKEQKNGPKVRLKNQDKDG